MEGTTDGYFDMNNIAEEQEQNSANGFVLKDFFLPEEIMTIILSFVDSKDVLKCASVCKNWNRIIKSQQFWFMKYKHTFKTRKLPRFTSWQLYYAILCTDLFNSNLIRNGNGEKGFKHWNIVRNGGDRFIIEDPPKGCEPLPVGVKEFNGRTSCFATSYQSCDKNQKIALSNLQQKVLNEIKPVIKVSEWVNGRFDCASIYKLYCLLISNNNKGDNKSHDVVTYRREYRVEQFMNPGWTKIEILIKEYPNNINTIIFEHDGSDIQFWAGHFGTKMAGACIEFIIPEEAID